MVKGDLILKGKKVYTPDELGVLKLKAVNYKFDKRTDFRGSEFSTSTTPKVNKRWFNIPFEYRFVGCSIDRLIARMRFNERDIILKEQLEFEPEEDVEFVLRFYDKDFNSIPAMVGTAIHKITSEPMKGLAHYRTLKKAGIKSQSSDCYTETPFYYTIELPDKQILTAIRPDAYLFFEKDAGAYDLMVMDLKTSRVLQYPEPKYLQQGLFYGWIIEQVVKEELDMKIDKRATSLN